MKNTKRFLAAVLCVASLLTLSAYAAPDTGEGLSAFDDVADMTSFTFTDVDSNDWSFIGIKSAYDMGILLGYQDGTYRPKANVTWGQAIVIAARIHSVYWNNALNTELRSGDYWYSPYLRYCQGNGMIPADCPKGVNLDRVTIPRYALAYIFSRTIDAEDMPAISDRQITDIGSIPAAYVSSVKLMYSSGIMTGWADYSFGGTRLTNREQIAVVVSRLLEPANRIGYDSEASADMADFEANMENDSAVVQIGKTYYCAFKYYESTSTEIYALYSTTGKDDETKLYTCKAGERLDNLYVNGGKVYFCVSTLGTCSGRIMSYDPASGKIDTVYEGYAAESYCFYNNQLYALLFTEYGEVVFGSEGSMDLSGWKYQFGQIVNGAFNALLYEMNYYEAMYFVPYGWNNCIYFKLGELERVGTGDSATDSYVAHLYEFDLSRGELQKLSDVNINTSFFDGHVMYFMAYDSEGNYDLNLYALSLQSPAAIKTIGTFPNPTDKRYRSIYKHDDTFYCLSAMNRNLYSMDEGGETRLALTCGGAYSSCCFTEDSMVLIPNTLVTSNVNEIKIYNADSLSARAEYGDWIGLSCYYKGARFVPEEGQAVWSSGEDSVSTVSDLSITVPEAFMRGEDLIVRTKYVNTIITDEENNTDSYVCLRMYIIKVYQGDTLVAYDINKMQTMELTPYDVQTFTFVVGGEDILGNIDVSADNFSIEIIPTYNIKIVDKSNNNDSGDSGGSIIEIIDPYLP